MKKFLSWGRVGVLALVSGVVFVTACETVQTTQSGVVGVDRSQRMAISSQEINQAASQQYAQLIAQEKRKGNVNKDPAQYNRVRTISQRLIQQVGIFRPDARNWNWEFNVLTSPEVNAWCMPGGKIAVYSGLIEKLNVTDDELAAVIGHEISHALREHSRERASEQAVAGIGIQIISAVTGLGDLGSQGMEFAYMGLL